jgi:hypothetical protein
MSTVAIPQTLSEHPHPPTALLDERYWMSAALSPDKQRAWAVFALPFCQEATITRAAQLA